MKNTFIGNSVSSYLELEKVRCEAYEVDYYVSKTYLEEVKKGNILMAGTYLDDKLVAGVYISSSNNSLYIEQLFVDSKYQKHNLHIGSSLLKYILDNKEEIEIYFDKKFSYSKLDTGSNLESFYEKIGYHTNDNYLHMVKRI